MNEDTVMNKLKPCPFCGYGGARFFSKTVVGYVDFRRVKEPRFYVYCGRCYARGGTEKTAEDAANKWNRRAGDV